MRRFRAPMAAFVLLGLAGCGAGDTFSPTLNGGGTPASSFTLAATPSPNTVQLGQTATYTVTATSTGGFSTPVSLSVNGLPVATTSQFSQTSVTPTVNGATSTLTVTTSIGSGDLDGTIRSSPATPTGTHTLTIIGTAGAITRQTTVQLVVQSGQQN